MRLKQLVVRAVVADARPDLPDAEPEDALKGWELVVTGHSLGGALATLFAFDVAEGLDAARGLPVRRPRSRPWFLPATGAWASREYPKFGTLTLVTLGAPRVGDVAFAARLDLAVPRHRRVVNGQDIVARLPRGFSYAHGGATVLLSASPEDAAVWVEGEDEGECPLRRGDGGLSGVVTNPARPGSPLATLLDDALAEAKTVRPFDMSSALEAARKVSGKAARTVSDASPSELAAAVGLDPAYVETELKMLSALSSGDAIEDHLEPAYFAAMRRARAEEVA